MLRVVPKGWFSRDFAILEHDQPAATVRFARSVGAASFAVGDVAYAIHQEHPGYGAWVLEMEASFVARAREVRTLFRHSFVIEYAGKRYQLENRSAFRRSLAFREGVEYVGYIEPERLFTNKLRACLPEYLPLAMRVFIVALAVNPWGGQDEIM